MQVNVPVSPQPNASFPKNPMGFENADKPGEDFSDVFKATSALRQQAEKGSNGSKKEARTSKADSNDDLQSEKEPISQALLKKDSSKLDNAEEAEIGHDPEIPSNELIPGDEVSITAGTDFQLGFTKGGQPVDVDDEDALKSHQDLVGKSVIKPVAIEAFEDMEQNPRRKVLPLESDKNRRVSFALKMDEQPAKSGLPAEKGARSVSAEASGNHVPVAGKVQFQDGEGKSAKVVPANFSGSENLNAGTRGNGMEKPDGSEKMGSIGDASKNDKKGKDTPIQFEHLREKTVASRKEFKRESIEAKIEGENRLENKGKKSVFLKDRADSAKTLWEETKALSAADKKERFAAVRAGEKGFVAKEDGSNLKHPMNTPNAAEVRHKTGGFPPPGKDGAPVSEPQQAVAGNRGETVATEKPVPNQKGSTANAVEHFIQPTNEKETSHSKSDAHHRQGGGDGANKEVFQQKEMKEIPGKIEISKGEETAPASRSNSISNTAGISTAPKADREVPESRTAKENLGSLVKTAAFLLKSGRQEARISLYPESMGHLKLRIFTENQQVTVRVMAETVAAKELIEQNLHQLKTDFQQQGLDMSKFDVSLSSDSERNSTGHNSFFTSNRTKQKSSPRKEESARQSDDLALRLPTNAGKGRSQALDFFA